MAEVKKVEQTLQITFQGRETSAHVTSYGDDGKPQLLCLHGIGSTGSESFENLARHLTKSFQLVIPDWIGFGKSSRLLNAADTYSADYCTEWLEKFITTAIRTGILGPHFSILAHSMSAIAVAKSYSRIKPYLNNLVFINPAGIDTHISRPFSFFLTSRLIPQRLLAWAILLPGIWYYVLRWNENHRKRMIQGLRDGEFEVLLRYARAGIRPIGKMKPTHVLPNTFAEITVPVLVISSSRDSIFYQREYLHFAKDHQWKVYVIAYPNHYLLTRATNDIAEHIVTFVGT